MRISKSLAIFLGITFGVSWPLFLLPLAFKGSSLQTQGVLTTVSWALAMWAPGVAALITTRFVQKRPLRDLGLRHLGDRHMYWWAWLLPIGLVFVVGGLTWLIGLGKIDLSFTFLREQLAQAAPDQGALPIGLIAAAQVLVGFTLAPLFNTLFAIGEELGWRGWLLPELLPLGQKRAILWSGVIWGVWHIPAVLQGLNYPDQPVLGSILMVFFTVFLGTMFSWLYLRTQSPWAPALAHGSVNAVAGLPLFILGGVNIILGGTLASLVGIAVLALFAAWLWNSGRLPVSIPEDADNLTA